MKLRFIATKHGLNRIQMYSLDMESLVYTLQLKTNDIGKTLILVFTQSNYSLGSKHLNI